MAMNQDINERKFGFKSADTDENYFIVDKEYLLF